jgi:di/tricarboxylate transporter
MFPLPLPIQAALTLLILGGALVCFVREKPSPDLTALLALLALLLFGILTPVQAFAGFSHPATLSVAAMLVLSAGLERTGALSFFARRVLAPLGRSEVLLTVAVMAAVALLSAFIANTAAVAVFIPVVLEVCRRRGVAPGRVLMPMAHAATFGGMCTLIGTSTNLAAHEYARSQGLPGFAMFELGRVALPMLLAGFAYILFVGRWFLPRGAGEAGVLERSGPYLAAVEVPAGSSWVGREARPDHLHRDFELEPLLLKRGEQEIALEKPWPRLEAGDRLRVRGSLEGLLRLAGEKGIRIHRPAGHGEWEDVVTVAEVVVLAGSGLLGRTLREARFAERHGCVVLALHRPAEALSERPEDTPIRAGDVLVVEGPPLALQALTEGRGFVLAGVRAYPDVRARKLGVALLTLVGVVTVAALGVLPIVTAAVAGCAVLILTGCLKPAEAYRAIDLSIVFLLAGALALGTALERTGLAAQVAQGLTWLSGFAGHGALLAGFFLVAVLVSEFMSNSGTVLLLAPIAVSTAHHLGVNPMAFMAAIAFGASAAFAMPIGYQTSLMIYGPGGYRFKDYLRMGIPLDLILAALALLLIPRYWPLSPP